MHELAITAEVLRVVLEYAAENNAHKVLSIKLKIGELRDITEEWLQRYFDYLSRDTIAAEAVIAVERVPFKLSCARCASVFTADPGQDKLPCPECHNEENYLQGGQEFLIESIGVI